MKHTTRLLTFLTLFTLLPTAANAASGVYVVSAGDTLSKIAREHQTTVSQLMQVNHLNTDRLSIGQTLLLGVTVVPDLSTAPPDLTAVSTSNGTAEQTANQPGQAVRVTADILNVRQSASLDAEIIGKLSYGSRVEVLETDGEWTKIRYENEAAFVASQYVSAAPDLGSSVPLDSKRLDVLENIVQPLLGTPYILGGTTPNGFDCSGFTSYVFNQLGVKLPRTSEDQFHGGQSIPLEEAQPGDLLFYDSMGKGHISHVAIYMGNGMIVHANGDDVRYLKEEYMRKLYPFYGVKRYVDFE